MSTRHVWEKFVETYKLKETIIWAGDEIYDESDPNTKYGGAHGAYGDSYIRYGASYLIRIPSPVEMFDVREGREVTIPKGKFFCINAYSDWEEGLWYHKLFCAEFGDITLTFDPETENTVGDVNCKKITYASSKGDSVGKASHGSASQYPQNGVAEKYWYVYQGADTIDPSAVSILDTPHAGRKVSVSVTPTTPKYGGAISYAYQYSVNDGRTWLSAGSSVEPRKDIAVPADAETFQVRIQASDDTGFTSADYVYSAAVNVSANADFAPVASIDHTYRNLSGWQFAVDGIHRDAVNMLTDIDGVQREIFAHQTGSALPDVIAKVKGTSGIEEVNIGKFQTACICQQLISTGTQYIDTGVKGNNSTAMEIKFRSTQNTVCACGADKVWCTDDFMIETLVIGFGKDFIGVSLQDGNWHTARLDKGAITVDGAVQSTLTANAFETPYNLHMFALNRDGAIIEHMTGDISYCKIWQDGVLVRDFVPYQDGQYIGMYDQVESVLYTNFGDGKFEIS